MTPTQFEFEAIGTFWKISIGTSLTTERQKQLLQKIKKRIDIFDTTYSRFREDSLITKISQKKGSYIFPPDAKVLFEFYRLLYDATNYSVTPLIGKTLEEAGYDALYTLKPKTLNKVPLWDDVIEYKHPVLIVKRPVLLDFGAAGKGYLVDIITRLIKQNKISDFYINAGGDIYHYNFNNDPIKVGLEHPGDSMKIIGVATISNQSICGSSGNRKDWGKFHHIIDPYTLSSPRNILSTWAVADSAMLADGMTTCLFFTSGKELKTKFDFEYLILFEDYSYEVSSNFSGELYTNTNIINS